MATVKTPAAPTKPSAKAAPTKAVAVVANAAPAKPVPAPVKNPVKTPSRATPMLVGTVPAVKTDSKTGKVVSPFDARFAALQAEIDSIEKTVGVETTSLIQSGYVQNAIHTGVLMYDFVVGGGAAPGRLSILPGLEGSGKSTIIDNLAAVCALQQIPIFWFDAEGALDANYVGRIFDRYGLKLQDLMGIRDHKTGKWVLPPMLRYSQESIGDKVFKTIAHICKALPMVKQRGDGVWFRMQCVKGRPNTWVEDERQGKPQFLFIVDSWPALLPEARADNPDSSPMAANARMIASGMPLIKAPIASRNCALLGVNQIRMKPGVTMGCLHATVKIPFVDGRVHTMKEIVDGQIQGEVWSLNEATGALEPKKITGWHDNGLVESPEDWVNIKATAIDTSNGFTSVTVTPDHEIKIGTGKKWKKAKAVKVGDKLLTKRVEIINSTLREFMLGKFVGDLSLYADKRAGNAQFKLSNVDQPEYLAWTLEKLSKHFEFKQYAGLSRSTGKKLPIHASPALAELKTWFEKTKGRRSFTEIGPDFTALSLAVWYMDDGCLYNKAGDSFGVQIAFKRFRHLPDEVAAVSQMLNRFGIEHSIAAGTTNANTHAQLTKAGADTLFGLIAVYVPSCMEYKIPMRYRGQYQDFDLTSMPVIVPVEVEVLEVRTGSARLFREKRKFDITVEDNHNYMAGSFKNGVIVHNSPEYEPCGSALGFFADVRTKIMKVAPSTIGAGKGQFTEEPNINGAGVDKYVYAKLKNTKNKAFTPYREGSIRIRFEQDGQPGDGICRTWDVTQFLIATGQAVPRMGQRLEMHLRPVRANGRAHGIFEEGQVVGRGQFKQIVEAREYKQALYQHCLQQIRSGYAFDIERESIKHLIATKDVTKGSIDLNLDGDSDEGGIEA